jgi:hypothetical protein
MIEGKKLKQISSVEILLGNVPGREIVVDGVQGKKMCTRVYVGGRNAFNLSLLADELEEFRSDSADRFYSSFQISLLPQETADEDSWSYRLGYLVGSVIMTGVVIATIAMLFALNRRQKRRTRYRSRRSR